MKEIYDDAKDLHVAATIIYTDGTSLYVDEAKTTKLKHDEALDLCFKTMIVYHLTSKTYFKIKSFKDDAGTLTVTLADDTAITVASE